MKPVIRLNTVVLPEPFGPIRPVMRALLQRQRASVDCGDAPESLGQAFDLEHAHGDWTPATVCGSLEAAAASGRSGARRLPSRVNRLVTEGTIPRGMSRMTSRNTAA